MAVKRNVLGLGARLTKLRAMSAGEISQRVRYRLVTAAERRRHAGQRLTPANRLPEALQRAFAGRDWQEQLLASRAAQRSRFFP